MEFSIRNVIISVCAILAIVAAVVYIRHQGQRAKVVRALIEDMQTRENDVRSNAREKIIAYKDRRTIAALVSLLGGLEGPIEQDVVKALGEMGEGAVEPLLDAGPALNDEWLAGTPSRTGDRVKTPAAAAALVRIGKAALPPLQRALSDDRAAKRALAARVLGMIGDPSCIGALAPAMKDKDPVVRRNAVAAMGMISDKRAVDALLSVPTDSDTAVRLAMVEALGKCGDSRAAGALKGLAEDADWEVQSAAVKALAGADKDAAIALAQSSLGGDPAVSAATLRALGRTKSADAVGMLTTALKSPRNEIEDAAAQALGEIGDRSTVDALIEAVSANDAPARWAVIDALRKIGDPKAVPVYISALGDKDPGVRKAAAYALESTKDPRAEKPVIARLSEETDGDVRATVAYALDGYDDAESAAALIDAYNDQVPKVRKAAIDSMADKTDPAAKKAIIDALEDEDPQVRTTAAGCLRKHPNPEAVDALVDVYEHDRNESVQIQMALALGCVKDDRALDALNKGVGYGSDDKQCATAIALSIMKDPRSAKPLIKELEGDHSRTWGTAPFVAYALVMIGTDEANAAVDNAVKQYDLKDVTANYRRYISRGNFNDVLPLMVVLARNGDMQMAEDFYWSNSGSLKWIAWWWAKSKDAVKELDASTDSPDRPKWQ